jgi:uncharacterized repeat protein (TIGR01451 family)
MDTVRYLSVCLNTLNLPYVLQNESHEVTKYLKQLSTIPTSMLMSDGLPLQTHLELIAEANPNQKYLLTKQGYSFDNFKAEVLKFQKSKGYSDLMYEYKAVGTEINRPHHFLQKNIVETPPPPTPPIVAPEMPEKLIELTAVENVPVAVNEKPISAPTENLNQRRPPESIISQKPIINPVATPTEPVLPKKTPQEAPLKTEVIRSRFSPPTANPVAIHPPVPEAKVQIASEPKSQNSRPMQIKPNQIAPQMSMPKPLKDLSLNAASQTGRVVQRASRITLPNLLSGGLKTIGSGLLGTIPGFSTNRTSPINTSTSFRGGGGGRGFIGRAIPLPSGGGRSWLVILLLLLGVVFVLAFFFGGPMEQLSNSVDIKNIEIVKSAPQSVENGSKITYNIIVRNKGSKSAQVVVSDAIPENSRYESGNNDPVASDSGKTVKNIQWTLSDVAGGEVRNLTFSVIPTKEDVWIINQARGTVTIAGGGGNVQIPGNIPPNQNNCGKWTFKTPLGNYGDPECNFTKDDLFTLLKQLDPVDASYWFYTVVRCESGYDPNNFLGASASGLGAYGLYQMNPSGKGNGKYDAGDVIWQLQTSNAVNYNNQLSTKWRYWACAQDRW